MKKYIGFIGVVMVNCMLITGLLVHAFTLSSIKDSENDNKKEYVYIEKTTVKEEKEIDPEECQQEDVNKDNKVNDSKNYTNNTHNYVVKTTTTKSTYGNDTNNTVNDSKNNSNINNSSNKNDNSNTNNNYTVEYTNTSYCGFCGKQLNNNDGICEDCREIRSKLGE